MVSAKIDLNFKDFEKLSSADKRKELVKSMGESPMVDILLKQMETNSHNITELSYPELGMTRKQALKAFGL